VGDIVITHWDEKYILGVGRVSGPFKRIMRYRYFKQTVPVQWFDIQPRAIPKGEKLTTSWSEHMIQELCESEFQHLMDVCQVIEDQIVKERFNLHLKKEKSAIQKDLQEDKICDLIDIGKVDDALELVTVRNVDMITDFAQDYLALKNYSHASRFYAKVIDLDPGNLGALNNLSFICLETGRYQEAIIYADQVLAINPEYSCSLLNKGTALLKLGRIE
jgi:tetratricopeptide (TPR) repeat protein